MMGVGEIIVILAFVLLVVSVVLGTAFGKKGMLRVALGIGAFMLVALFLALAIPFAAYESRRLPAVPSRPSEVPPVPELSVGDWETPTDVNTPERIEWDFAESFNYDWDENIEAGSETNVYTQGRFAIAELARKIAGRIKEKVSGNAYVLVTENRGSYSNRLKNFHSLAIDEITNKLADERFDVGSRKPKGQDDDSNRTLVAVELELDQISGKYFSLTEKKKSSIDKPISGNCRAKVTINDIDWNCSSAFVDNLWLSDFEAFQTAEPNERFTRVLTLSDLYTSLDEAERDLDVQLKTAYRSAFKRYFKRRWPHRSVPDVTSLYAAIAASEHNGNRHDDPVVDRFSQSLTIEGKKYVRAAALIQDSRMSSIAHDLNTNHNHSAHYYSERDRNAGVTFPFLSIIGIFGVVVIGYYAADAATRGYYSPVLAALCVVIFITMSVII